MATQDPYEAALLCGGGDTPGLTKVFQKKKQLLEGFLFHENLEFVQGG